MSRVATIVFFLSFGIGYVFPALMVVAAIAAVVAGIALLANA